MRLLGLILLTMASTASHAANDLQWSAYGDGYYTYNMNSPNTTANPQNGYRAYDQDHNSMVINNVGARLSKNVRDFSLLAQLDFGPQSDILNGTGDTRNISQLYISFQPFSNKDWILDLGKFYSHMGYETPLAKDNWNYSRSAIYAYGTPTWHVGARLHQSAKSSAWSSAFMLVNGWDNATMTDNNHGKTLGAQFKYAPSNQYWVAYNGIVGPEKQDNDADITFLHEVLGQYAYSETTTFGFDAIFGTTENEFDSLAITPGSGTKSKWNGFALYARFKTSDKFAFAPRIEMFTTEEMAGTLSLSTGRPNTKKEKLTAVTASILHNLGENLEARYEVRNDSSDYENAFADDGGEFTDSQMTLTAALLFQF